MSDLRVAIVGYGLAGSVFHAPLVASTPGLTVACVVTRNPERQEQVRREYPDAEALSMPDQIWQRSTEHDLVVVATPNDSHVPLARQALDAGLPVVVDKPLATSAAQGRELVAHAEQLGVLLTAFHNRRWDSDQLTLRRLLSDGTLGTVTRYESRFERWRPELKPEKAWREMTTPAEGGGVLFDLGTHLVDQALVLFGPAARVYGEVAIRRGAAADDDAFVAIQHASGVHSHLWASSVAAAPGPRIRVLGARAGYLVTDVDGQEDALRSGARPGHGSAWGVEPRERWGLLVRGDERDRVESEPGAWPEFYAGVERAIRSGGPPPVDPRDAVVVLDVLEAARRSAESGAVVEL